MPTASAKPEKFASNEASDAIKQIVVLVEKKVRNLEKRKGKLDNYRNDHKNGKELNEDQKNAITKYDQVIEVLEFTKELQKSFNLIFQECARQQKKAQKKELAERQYHEFQQIRQLLLFQDILTKLLSEDIRNDFLNGRNGAVKLSEEEISSLEEFYKVVSPDETSEQNEKLYEKQFSVAAEHFVALVEAKNKEVGGTTYKNLKEILTKIQECGYFAHSLVHSENEDSPVEEPEPFEEENGTTEEHEEEFIENEETTSVAINGSSETLETPPDSQGEETVTEEENKKQENGLLNHQLQDVLPIQGNFNFLQESQIDMESPHMDPAVVAAHPMAPPPSQVYRQSQYNSTSESAATHSVTVENEATPYVPTTIVVPIQPLSVPTHADPTMTLSQAALNHPSQEYDPNQPIPTQTFTNQNFVAMQNIMTVVSPYVPVTPSTHNYTSVTYVPQQTSDISTSHVQNIEVSATANEKKDLTEKNPKESSNNKTEESIGNGESSEEHAESESTLNQNEVSAANHYPHMQNNHQSRSFNNRGSRGRGRGYNNRYIRGRGNYGNGGRGYYQNSYGGRDSSGSSSGYNGYRRSTRGTRGGIRGGNNRSGYRPQP